MNKGLIVSAARHHSMGNHKSFVIAVILLIVAIAGLLCPLPNHYRSPWLMKMFDLGHVPLFFMVTICFWALCGRKTLLAMGLATLLAVAAEVVQSQIDRSGNVLDVCRGMIGVALAGFVLRLFREPFGWRMVAIGNSLAIALLFWPIYDCGPVLVDAIQAYRSFPVLSDFQSRWEPQRWFLTDATLERQAQDQKGKVWAGVLQIAPNADSSGAILFPIVQDWSGFQRLRCEFSFSGDPLKLLLSIRDGKRVVPPLQRFDMEREFGAGRHSVAIELPELAKGKKFSPLNLSRVQSFHFVAKEVTQPRSIMIHRIWLE